MEVFGLEPWGLPFFYDGKSFTKYDESSGIVHRFILSINEDKNNNIWFGVYGGGLYKYNGRTFSNFNVKMVCQPIPPMRLFLIAMEIFGLETEEG